MNVVVTGANKGIGLEVVRGLVAQGAAELQCVVLACRDVAKGEAALASIGGEAPQRDKVQVRKLDLDDDASLQGFVDGLKRDGIEQVDVLVNNAGIMFGSGSSLSFQEQSGPTLKTNFFQTTKFTELALPMVRDGGKVINVASQLGTSAFKGCSAERQEAWRAAKTPVAATALVHEFQAAVAEGTTKAGGWPSNNYGMSKLGLIAWTKATAAANPRLHMSSMCPGWCATDMGSAAAPRSPAQGADTILFLALEQDADKASGEFWSDRRIVSFL